MGVDFRKYHALGNDYIVIDPTEFPFIPVPEAVQAICDRNRGVGSDGILLGPLVSLREDSEIAQRGATADFSLRIFNPDGSEAEKSGNGLRIFSLYLSDRKYVGAEEFSVDTLGGLVRAKVERGDPARIEVDMGLPSFDASREGLRIDSAEFVDRELDVGSEKVRATFVSMGNPHCVIFVDEPRREIALRLGPLVETHSIFPHRTNVQFAKVLDRHKMRIEIWERGAGYTLASGSSSCAAAAVARRLGLVDGRVEMVMPGGKLELDLSASSIRMTGPAEQICSGEFSETLKRTLLRCGALGAGRK
jgi:diaminopimelate epimerase